MYSLDSSCLIALISEWHKSHERTVAAYQEMRAAGSKLVLSGHAVLECYSVVTRLPSEYRLSPRAVEIILRQAFLSQSVIPDLPGDAFAKTIHSAARNNLGGGRSYDAFIAETVFDAGARLLLTWNVKRMLPVAPAGLEVREP